MIVIAVPSAFSRTICTGGDCAKHQSFMQTFFTIPQLDFTTFRLHKVIHLCGSARLQQSKQS
jgi:hypothetical protein